MLPSRQSSSGRSPRSSRSKRGETAIDRKQSALVEKEEQLRKQQEKLKQLIEDAPRMREEQARRRREELASDTRLTSRRSLGDRRYNVSAVAISPSFGTRRLRSEKRDGKLLFVFLCVVLMVLVYWICQLFAPHFAR